MADNGLVCESCGSDNLSTQKGVCLNCGASIKGRIRPKVMAVIALVLVLIGAGHMYIVAYVGEGVVHIKDLDKDYDSRHVSIEGVITDVSHNVEKYEEFGSFRFEVYDGTGVVSVSTDEEVSKALYDRGDIPLVGIKVRVGGMFYGDKGVVGDWNGRKVYSPDGIIKVSSAERIKFLDVPYNKKDPHDIRDGNVTAFNPGDGVVLNGTLTAIVNVSSGLVLKLNAMGVEVSAIIPSYMFDIGAYSYDIVKVGDELELRGGLEWYQSAYGDKYSYWEVVVHTLSVTGQVEYKHYSLSTLLNNPDVYEGESVNTTGVVDHIYWESGHAGEDYTFRFKIRPLTDASPDNPAALVYIEDRDKNIEEGAIQEGSLVEVHGVFQSYTYASGDVIWEIVIRTHSTDSVSVIAQNYTGPGGEMYVNVALGDILTNPEAYNRTLVNTTGVVDYIYWDSGPTGTYTQKFKIRVSDSGGSGVGAVGGVGYGGSIVVYIEDKDKAIRDLYSGSVVMVKAEVKKYMYEGGYYWELLVRANTADEVFIIQLQPPEGVANYTDVAFDEIIGNEGAYNNTLVHVYGAVVSYIYWTSSTTANYTNRFKLGHEVDANDTILVYIGDESKYLSEGDIEEGQSVEVYGMFQLYVKGDYKVWEIYIRPDTNDRIEGLRGVF